MEAETRIWSTVDLEQDGWHADFLRLPYSSDESAFGWIPIPLISIKNGAGPTALLVAGNHGDEYEGQVALTNLVSGLQLAEIRGQLIVLPALNAPAVVAGRRNSPLDGGNLNRSFPGNPYGSPTAMIAHYVTNLLLPRADLVVDLHSGGRSLEFLPSALMRPGRTPDEQLQLRELIGVFAAPISYMASGKGGGGPTTLSAAAEQQGVPAVTTELGGGGTLSQTGVAVAEAGLRRLLKHVGIATAIDVNPPPATRFMSAGGRQSYVYAPEDGLFEPLANLGDTVGAGQLAARLHFPARPSRAPLPIEFETDGFVICRRALAKSACGDCLFQLLKEE